MNRILLFVIATSGMVLSAPASAHDAAAIAALSNQVSNLQAEVSGLTANSALPFEIELSGPPAGIKDITWAVAYFPTGTSPNTPAQSICKDAGFDPKKTLIAGMVYTERSTTDPNKNAGYITRVYCRR